jgi:hypothetical protein
MAQNKALPLVPFLQKNILAFCVLLGRKKDKIAQKLPWGFKTFMKVCKRGAGK